jgi:hypothetical protein
MHFPVSYPLVRRFVAVAAELIVGAPAAQFAMHACGRMVDARFVPSVLACASTLSLLEKNTGRNLINKEAFPR